MNVIFDACSRDDKKQIICLIVRGLAENSSFTFGLFEFLKFFDSANNVERGPTWCRIRQDLTPRPFILISEGLILSNPEANAVNSNHNHDSDCNASSVLEITKSKIIVTDFNRILPFRDLSSAICEHCCQHDERSGHKSQSLPKNISVKIINYFRSV